MDEFALQSKVWDVLLDGEWYTVGEVASAIGQKKNSSIRCILDTLCWTGDIERCLLKAGRQREMNYRFTAAKGGTNL